MRKKYGHALPQTTLFEWIKARDEIIKSAPAFVRSSIFHVSVAQEEDK
jgi:hypothetical protein